MKNIAVFASGNGSNFQAIAGAIKKGILKANLKLLVCDNPKGFVLERAKKFKVKTLLINPQASQIISPSTRLEDCSERSRIISPSTRLRIDFEDTIIKSLKAEEIDLIVLAGYLRILGPYFVSQYKNKILNIHPALLPSFKGGHALKDAFDYGVKVTGVTVHFVDEKMDHGPIILQEPVRITEMDSLETLEKKIHQLEHKIYPQAIKLVLSGRLKIMGRKVWVG